MERNKTKEMPREGFVTVNKRGDEALSLTELDTQLEGDRCKINYILLLLLISITTTATTSTENYHNDDEE